MCSPTQFRNSTGDAMTERIETLQRFVDAMDDLHKEFGFVQSEFERSARRELDSLYADQAACRQVAKQYGYVD
jgi:hypothetical protein